MRKRIAFTLLLIFVFSSQIWAGKNKNPPPQLVVTTVETSFGDPDSFLLIYGENFGPTPEVFLGTRGGELESLIVVASAESYIEAILPEPDPGTYLLIVRSGSSAGEIFAIDVTLGATGPQGPPGVSGYSMETDFFNMVSLPVGESQGIYVWCPEGKVPTGGGGRTMTWTGSRPRMTESGPLQHEGLPVGWIVSYTCEGPTSCTTTVSVFALCISAN